MMCYQESLEKEYTMCLGHGKIKIFSCSEYVYLFFFFFFGF